jgi:hypothetical protein
MVDAWERHLEAPQAEAQMIAFAKVPRRFALGDRVRKAKGSSWQGRVCGFYTTSLTPVGYAVESEREPGSVQIYPEAALEAVSASPE